MKKTFIVILILITSIFSQWIAKIDKKVISKKEFQKYIDIQKMSLGNKSQNIRSIIKNDDELKSILNQFIENKITLMAANKEGFTRTNKKVLQIFNKQKKDYIKQIYLSQKIDISKIKVKESDLRAFYEKRKSSLPKGARYELIKKQIYQAVMVEKLAKKKALLLKKYEKKYKIKKNKLDSFYITIINTKKIKRSNFNDNFNEQLKMMGATKDQLKNIPKSKLNEMKLKVLDDMILDIILSMEMKKDGFSKNKKILDMLELLKDNIAIQLFIKAKFLDKVVVTNDEIMQEYDVNKKKYSQLGFDQARKYITETIKQKKGFKNLELFVEDKKLGSIIRKNYDALSTIK